MKVLFLDIDGVLQSRRSIVAYGNGGHPFKPYPMDEVAFQLLRRTIEQTGAYIVVSSSWRGGGVACDSTWFASYGWYDPPIIGHTPRRGKGEHCRGHVIERWIGAHSTEVERYVIVDDSNDMLSHQPLVHVDGREGYLYRDHRKAVSILEGEKLHDHSNQQVKANE